MKEKDELKQFYKLYLDRLVQVRSVLDKPLTLTEKILYSHLYNASDLRDFKRGVDYINFKPDRVAMQDATAQMALLQFVNLKKEQVALPTTVHCDHLIEAKDGALKDLESAQLNNGEVYDFLKSVSSRYGIGFWNPGSGIIHQVLLENYALPGGLMVGTDSHTPNAGGLGMLAIGVGGAEAVEVMAGMPWELRIPKIIGVKLTGALSGWTSPKDVILKLAGILTVTGGTNAVIEYFGEGTKSISATGKATICNMGAEIGATSSLFPYDNNMMSYLRATNRADVVKLAQSAEKELQADQEVINSPELYYNRIVEIDLSSLEPHINGPYTPDIATPISEFKEAVLANNWPNKLEVGLIGSCTNSSYEDLTRAVSIIEQAISNKTTLKSKLLVNPGSEQIRLTIERDGLLNSFAAAGAVIMANACGPCIGQWQRGHKFANQKNSIITSFNRNFAKRTDGNELTHVFITSPEIVAAFAIAGDLSFNPLTDSLLNDSGVSFKLAEPKGEVLPPNGFLEDKKGLIVPTLKKEPIVVAADSERLQLLKPFAPWSNEDFQDMALLLKVKGKCTTDHISMAGSWLRYRGHLENISDNLLMGAINAFNGSVDNVWSILTKSYNTVSKVAKEYKHKNIPSVVVAEDNYGEGSSREHAAMEPRYLNVKVILAKSFARIHETNLKKQGVLALTFTNPSDYNLIEEFDKISISKLESFSPSSKLELILTHENGSSHLIEVQHSYNQQQIEWFYAGSALNTLK